MCQAREGPEVRGFRDREPRVLGGPEGTRAGAGGRAGLCRTLPCRLLIRDKAKRQRHSRTVAGKTEGVPHSVKIVGERGGRAAEEELKHSGSQ